MTVSAPVFSPGAILGVSLVVPIPPARAACLLLMMTGSANMEGLDAPKVSLIHRVEELQRYTSKSKSIWHMGSKDFAPADM